MSNQDYALVVYINPHNENKDISEVHICKRIKRFFHRDKKVNAGEVLLKVIDTKDNIYKLRNHICNKIDEVIPNRKYKKHTQGSEIHIPSNRLNDFKDLLQQNGSVSCTNKVGGE